MCSVTRGLRHHLTSTVHMSARSHQLSSLSSKHQTLKCRHRDQDTAGHQCQSPQPSHSPGPKVQVVESQSRFPNSHINITDSTHELYKQTDQTYLFTSLIIMHCNLLNVNCHSIYPHVCSKMRMNYEKQNSIRTSAFVTNKNAMSLILSPHTASHHLTSEYPGCLFTFSNAICISQPR